MPSRWKCVCAYNGGSFDGWQSQPSQNGIQDVIEARLATMFGEPVRIHGSGRTDAGVHAYGQVFHFDAAWKHGAGKLVAAMRVGLPPAIQIKSAKQVGVDFHARFSATGKRYLYHIYQGHADPFTRPLVWMLERPRPLDIPAMRTAANLLVGRHDFAGFAADNGADMNDTVRDLRSVKIKPRGRSVRIDFEADGFLYKMVRSLVGALVSVGAGKLSLDDIETTLDRAKRTEAVQTAPPQGLFLERVFY